MEPAPVSDNKAYQRFLQRVKSDDERYDPEARMIRRPFSSPGYHTALKDGFVHPTRDSLSYAITCLDAGDEEHRRRAEDILHRVISLQDPDPNSKTFGIWPWYAEEPLEKMDAPDPNWADFCGASLIQVILHHRDLVSEAVRREAEQSLRRACEAIIRRDVGPGYTNIAVLGTYVTLVGGETMGWKDVEAYGMKRLRRFYEYTIARKSFDEYNSPTYTRVAINELSRLLTDARNPEAAPLVRELHEMAWIHLARRFHEPTRQWAGPHSRCYSTLQGRDFVSFLQMASDGKLGFIPQDEVTAWPRQTTHMPDSVLPYFKPLIRPRTETEVFVPASESAPAVVGITYLHPKFALGSVNHSMFWNQRRSVVAYWGTLEAPSYLHLRFLHDGYDFCSAWVFTTQREDSLLAAVTLCTDGGDTHPSLDKVKDGRINASDLRLRLEIGGEAAKNVRSSDWSIAEPLDLTLGGLNLGIQMASGSFDGRGVWGRVLDRMEASSVFRPRPGQKQSTDAAAVDVILYTGPERSFDLARLKPTFIGLALNVGTGDAKSPWAKVTEKKDLTLTWDLPAPLRLSAPIGPLTGAELLRRYGEITSAR